MLNITILAISKIKESYWQDAAFEYEKRLKPYCRIRIEELKAEPFSDSTKVKAKEQESKRLENFLQKKEGADIYLLSEYGESLDSLSFSKKIDSNKELVLVIAGTQGFSDQLFKAYPKISLSPLTFPHELARVILLEQIYRAATIINKKDYHY